MLITCTSIMYVKYKTLFFAMQLSDAHLCIFEPRHVISNNVAF